MNNMGPRVEPFGTPIVYNFIDDNSTLKFLFIQAQCDKYVGLI